MAWGWHSCVETVCLFCRKMKTWNLGRRTTKKPRRREKKKVVKAIFGLTPKWPLSCNKTGFGLGFGSSACLAETAWHDQVRVAGAATLKVASLFLPAAGLTRKFSASFLSFKARTRERETFRWATAAPRIKSLRQGQDSPAHIDFNVAFLVHCKKCYVKSTEFCCLSITKTYDSTKVLWTHTLK